MEDLKLEDDEPIPSANLYGVGPLLSYLSNRELGNVGKRHLQIAASSCPNAKHKEGSSDEIAEERLITKEPLRVLPCKLLGNQTRCTFLMVFSPDKELLASTHGDHNIYISEVKTGECIQTLKGHPRTPWCVAFHPSHDGLLASGCLGGHVRIWDLNGGSELWTTDSVINSLAFHPLERLLVVATLNQLHFWDWSLPEPFCKVVTKTDKEKVRFVKFDPKGHQLITGIANLPSPNMGGRSIADYTYENNRLSQRRMARNTRRHYPIDVNPPPTYGMYYRGTVRPRPIIPSTVGGGLTSAATTVSTSSGTSTSSASQTLSDLAAAASDQLMAENAAAEAAAAIADAAEAAAEAASVLEPRMRHLNEDPLLSDHPYGSQRARPPPPTTPSNTENPLLSDHPYGSPTGGRPPPTGLANWENSDLWSYRPSRSIPPVEEIYQRERRVQQLLMRFRHSRDSSFVEVNNSSNLSSNSSPSGSRDNPPTSPTSTNSIQNSLQTTPELFRQIRERRMERNARRQYLLDRIFSRRQLLNRASPGSNPGSTNPANRPIDDWAFKLRLALQHQQLGGFRMPQREPNPGLNLNQASTDDNDDNDSITAQFGDFETPRLIEPEVSARSLSTLDANILQPSSNRPSTENALSPPSFNSSFDLPSTTNDHNYTLNPEETSNLLPPSTAAGPSGSSSSTPPDQEPQPSTSRGTGNENSQQLSKSNINKAYASLFRHLDQKQWIFRDEGSADSSASRRRRQLARIQFLKKFRKMVEDLEKHILTLAASQDELRRSSPNSSTNNNEDSDEDDLETTAQLGLDERNYDERVGEGYHMRSLARSNLSRSLNSANSSPASRSSNTRLSRVHNQLVSQMRATFHAMEMSPDLGQRGKSPLAAAKVKNSQAVMEKTQKTATVVKLNNTTSFKKSSSNTKQELRALSQRLEKVLREQRENQIGGSANISFNSESLSGVQQNSGSAETASPRDYVELNIPRPDPLSIDPRKRWRHMYDGSVHLSMPPSAISPSTSRHIHNVTNLLEGLDSSESGSESDLDFHTGAHPNLNPTSAGVNLRSSPRFMSYPRRHSPRRLRWGPMDQRHLHARFANASSSRRQYLASAAVGNQSPSSTMTSDLNDMDTSENIEDIGTERLPPLRAIIWRRLRRRNAHLAALNDDESNNQGLGRAPGPRSHREGLSWMVDQMRIDQATNTASSGTSQQQSDLPSTSSRSIPSVPVPPGLGPYWQDPYNHSSFRAQYVNRIRPDDPPPRMSFGSRGFANSEQYSFANTNTSHRIQAWDFTKGDIPDLTDSESNLVVPEAKIHNDASVDVSEDGSVLVTLVPANLPTTTMVGVYGLLASNKGRIFATFCLELTHPVSVSLSPTSKHLMVGYSMKSHFSRPTRLSPSDRSLMAQIFRLKMPWECVNLISNSPLVAPPSEIAEALSQGQNSSNVPCRGRLVHRRDLHHNEPVETYLNCIRWIPVSGMGLVYATNTGLLKILR